MNFHLPNLLSDEVKESAEKALQSALTILDVGMKNLVEDEKTFNEVVEIGYGALPLPIKLFLRKDNFRLFIVSLKERYVAERLHAGNLNDQLALPLSTDSDLTSGEAAKPKGE